MGNGRGPSDTVQTFCLVTQWDMSWGHCLVRVPRGDALTFLPCLPGAANNDLSSRTMGLVCLATNYWAHHLVSCRDGA